MENIPPFLSTIKKILQRNKQTKNQIPDKYLSDHTYVQPSDGFKRLLLEYGSQQSIAVNKYHVYISIITKLCCTSITSCWFAIWKLNKLCSKKKNSILRLPKGAIQVSTDSRRLHGLSGQRPAWREAELSLREPFHTVASPWSRDPPENVSLGNPFHLPEENQTPQKHSVLTRSYPDLKGFSDVLASQHRCLCRLLRCGAGVILHYFSTKEPRVATRLCSW